MKKIVSFILVLSFLFCNVYIVTPSTSAYAATSGIKWIANQNKFKIGSIVSGKNYIGLNYQGGVFNSPDGKEWTRISQVDVGYSIYFLDYAKNTYVLGTRNGVMTSVDGVKWDTASTPKINPEVLNAENGFFMIAKQEAKSFIYTSADGLKWDSIATDCMDSPSSIAYGANKYVLAGYGVMPQVWNGKTWTTGTVVNNSNVVFDIYGNNKITEDLHCYMNDVTYGNGNFVATGSFEYGNSGGDIIATSKDGLSWTISSPLKDIHFNSVQFGYNNLFYVTASDGNLYTSKDAVTWTVEDKSLDDGVSNISLNNNQVICFNEDQIAIGKTDAPIVPAVVTPAVVTPAAGTPKVAPKVAPKAAPKVAPKKATTKKVTTTKKK